MFQFMRGIAFIAAVIATCGASFAEDVESANYAMSGRDLTDKLRAEWPGVMRWMVTRVADGEDC